MSACSFVCVCVFMCVCVYVGNRVCMCMCACVHKCVRPRAYKRDAVCVCDIARVECGRRHTADASRASRQSHLTVSPVYESSEGGEESAYDDRMSLERLCATCRAARAHARRASDHSSEPAAARSAWRRLQSLHLLLTRRWAQMEAPPQSTQMLRTRLCSQMEDRKSVV